MAAAAFCRKMPILYGGDGDRRKPEAPKDKMHFSRKL
jgi:hypothetical protein